MTTIDLKAAPPQKRLNFGCDVHTRLTATRLVAPLAVGATLCTPTGAPCCAAGVFAAACVTDFADGFLARRWRVESAFGAFADPARTLSVLERRRA